MTFLRRSLLALLTLALLTLATGYWWLSGSLPQLDGQRSLAGLAAPVTITRDQQGIVDIQAQTRTDIAFGLGFVHAQERFFQMDLQRRNSAGELSELFGEAALDYDKRVRRHRFRARAERNLSLAGAQQQALVQAYTDGVNAGLAALERPPFEYALLQQTPRTWATADSLLTVFSMILVLQDDEAWFERTRGLMHESLPADLYAFFTQQGGEWDAPLIEDPDTGDRLAAAPLPASGWSDLLAPGEQLSYTPMASEDTVIGSNNWAVAGQLSKHGGAIVADDMHLAIRVPNIWFRAQWRHPDSGRLVSGATLPGTPFVVAGSNGKLAWGFTNTQGDWSDLILLDSNEEKTQYLTADGWQDFAIHSETIALKDGSSVVYEVKETRWGPVIAEDAQGRLLAMRWTAHDPEGANTGAMALETTDTVAEAQALAPSFGIPHQNLMLGDDSGVIGWTIAGPFPKRVGTDGLLPERWSDGSKGWDGMRGLDEQPRVYAPASGRLWTANSRTLSGEALAMMGDSAYALGARQQQIRDRLRAQDSFDERDLLAIQLDDRAVFLGRWQARLLALLDGETEPMLVEARTQIANWGARADKDSVGYRLVREFRLKAIELITAPLETYLSKQDPSFKLSRANRQIEYPAWQLLEARPAHLLNPDLASWRELELAAIRRVLEPLYRDGSLANDSWGEANRAAIQHPMARFVKPIDWWLSMPDEPMHGDDHMPRVQTPKYGASERFAVSPGKEDQGYFHMATGQSAHPLSPFFGLGHRDWVDGKPSPWLKGETRYSLVLQPELLH